VRIVALEMRKDIWFDSINKEYWIKNIALLSNREHVSIDNTNESVSIHLTSNINKNNFAPIHIVLFACLVKYFEKLNYRVSVDVQNAELLSFLDKELNLISYFSDGCETVHYYSIADNILNLWRIESGQEKGYSMSVTEFFKRSYFHGYDLTILQTSLDEIFLNVADHAQASGIAFSYIYYDQKNKLIRVAVCDFGVGIPASLKKSYPDKYTNDTEALRDSLEIGVSARTNPHNKGFGLDLVVSNLSSDEMLRIVSNKALLFCKSADKNIKIYPLDFDFPGTLIYFDVKIDSFPPEGDTLFDVII
jgi:anti-sigma regulatory factor (Ser/Thr protein kinase)